MTGINEIVIFVCLFVIAFFLGKLNTLQKSNTQTAQIAFAASLWAITEAKALKDGVIIQRTIEKLHLVDKKDETPSENVKQMTEAMESALNGLNVKNNKIIEKIFDPKDLV